MKKKTRIGVLISGSGTNLQALIDEIEKGTIPAEISVVISNRSKAYGLQRAARHGIQAIFLSRKAAGGTQEFNRRIVRELKDRDIDLVVLAGYMSILTPFVVQNFPNRIINIHPALIPSFCGKGYYGINVHQAVLDYGAKVSGATVHFVDQGTDTGAIILQQATQVHNTDTPETLQQRILKIEHKLLPQAVRLFCQNKLKVMQSKGKRAIVKIEN